MRGMTEPDERDEQAVARFVEQFSEHLVVAGMPRMAARVFVRLLVSDTGRMTAAELAGALLISPAAISGAVRYLKQVELVAREREPGSRRDVYRLVGDTWYELMTSRDQQLTRWVASLAEGVAVLGVDSAAGKRLAETREFMDFLVVEMSGMLERWRTRQR